MDLLSKLSKTADHNRYKIAALLVVGLILFYGIGCESKTASIVNPGNTVNAATFNSEAITVSAGLTTEKAQIDAQIAAYNAKAAAIQAQIAAGVADLEKQEQIKAELFNLAGSAAIAATTGQVNPEAVVGTVITAAGILLGLGSALDSRRKDAVISGLKKKTAETPPKDTTAA
jgi:hypothetical protein